MRHSGAMVKEAMKAKGMKQVELARKIGRDQTLISRYLSGQIEISDKAARSIAEVLEMDFEKLHLQLQYDRLERRMENMRMEFKDVIGDEGTGESASVGAVIMVEPPDVVAVPLLDSIPASAHSWSGEGSAKYYLPPGIHVDAENSFAVAVTGKNMADYNVDEGDIIVVDTNAKAQDNDIVLAVVKGTPMLRKIHRKGSTIVLQALAEHEEPVIFLSQKDDFEIVGRLMLYSKFF